MSENLKSCHIFLFPFKWDYLKKDQSIETATFESRTSLLSFYQCLNPQKWILSKYHEIDPVNYYNDYAYFYDFVRPVIFNTKNIASKDNMTDSIVLNFWYNFPENDEGFYYKIHLKKQPYLYVLKIRKVTLNVYETGIGVLGFHLENFSSLNSAEDILKINDFGRRIYPQFLDSGVKDSPQDDKSFLNAVYNAFLARMIEIGEGRYGCELLSVNFNRVFNAEFENYVKNNPYNLKNIPVELVGFLGEKFAVESNDKNDEDRILVKPILDDRMFVISWYGNNELVQKLKWIPIKNSYGYLDNSPSENDFWMKYLFVDNSGNSCQSRVLQEKLLKEHTYDRWIDYGTLFGIGRYSFVVLTGYNDFVIKYLVPHVQSRYYEMAQLVLVQRATMLRFSSEIVMVTSKDREKVPKQAEYLYTEYIKFINKIYFREVTPQEQGIEMYNMFQISMDVEQDVEKLNREISELYQYVNILKQDDQSRAANKLAWLATILLPASILTGILGMNTMPSEIPPLLLGGKLYIPFWISLLLIGSISVFFYYLIKYLLKNGR